MSNKPLKLREKGLSLQPPPGKQPVARGSA